MANCLLLLADDARLNEVVILLFELFVDTDGFVKID